MTQNGGIHLVLEKGALEVLNLMRGHVLEELKAYSWVLDVKWDEIDPVEEARGMHWILLKLDTPGELVYARVFADTDLMVGRSASDVAKALLGRILDQTFNFLSSDFEKVTGLGFLKGTASLLTDSDLPLSKRLNVTVQSTVGLQRSAMEAFVRVGWVERVGEGYRPTARFVKYQKEAFLYLRCAEAIRSWKEELGLDDS